MRLLLDTHVVLWLALNSPALSKVAARAIFNLENEIFVSIASAWETAIKISIGKLHLSGGVSEFFRILNTNDFKILPLLDEHVKCVETLPFLHSDPFDRIIVASALTERMCLVTADENIRRL